MNSGSSSTTMTRSSSDAIATAAAAAVSVKAGKRPVRALSPQEKLQAIMRVHEGESKASVARDIGVPESTLRGWCKNEAKITSYARQQSASPESDTVEPRAKKQRTSTEAATVANAAAQPFNLSLRTRGSSAANVSGTSASAASTSRQSYSPLMDASPAVAQALSRNLTRRQSPTAAHTPSRHLHMNGGTSSGTGTGTGTSRTDELSADLQEAARSSNMFGRLVADVMAARSAGYSTAAYEAQLLNWPVLPPNYSITGLAATPSAKKSTPLNIDTTNNGHRLTSSPLSLDTGDNLLTTVTASLADTHQAQRLSPSKGGGLTQEEKLALWMQSQQQVALAQTYLQQLSSNLTTTPASTSNGLLTTATSPGLTGAATGTGTMDSPYSAAFARMMSDRLLTWYRYNNDVASLQTVVGTAARARNHSTSSPAETVTTQSLAAATDDAERRILYQHLTRGAESVSPKRKRPSATVAAPKKTPEYVGEQEVAQDLSTGKDRSSTCGNASDSSPAGSPSSILSSSMSLPSPTNPTSNSAPLATDFTPTSPQPCTSPGAAAPPAAAVPCNGSATPALFGNGGNQQHPSQQQPEENGEVPARRLVRPRRKLNKVLAMLEIRNNDMPEEEAIKNEAVDQTEEARDWRDAIRYGGIFTRWLERSQDPAVSSFQVNSIKLLMSNITKTNLQKENKSLLLITN